MKTLFLAVLLTSGFNSFAQYYYRDIIGTKETEQMIQSYLRNKVTRVSLTSYDADNTRSDDFFVEQIFSTASLNLKTTTRSGMSDQSILITTVNAKGQVVKTTDSTGIMVSTTSYTYNADGTLAATTNNSTDTTKNGLSEDHIWQYVNGKVSRMLRIKDKVDTTVVQFKLDDNSNVVEEQSFHKGVKNDPVYYYYDSKNRLTDIVRFNNKAKRLLPEYMFEYSDENQVIQRITVPANGSNYLIWRYQYSPNGLKVKEAVFDKQKQLIGKIEYSYQFGG
ncbi:MAG: hypothetical protein C4329_03590 [Chitinophagaceae bacterium]